MYKQLFIFLMAAEKWMLPCLNKKLFGVECPGCGLQRSVVLLFKGDFLGAFHMYPAIYPIVIVLLFTAVNFFIKIKHAYVIRVTLLIVMGLTMMISYIIKMSHFFH
jgi:hypothetical protein